MKPPSPRPRFALLALSAALCAPPAAAASPYADPGRWLQCRGTPLFDWLEPARSAVDRETAAVDIDAETVDVSAQDVYVLQGAVRLERGDQVLRADRLDYSHSQASYRARGDVRYQDANLALAATSAEGELREDRSRLQGVRYQLLGLRGNGAADEARIDGPRGALSEVSYSTCDPDQPSWTLRAGALQLDRERGVGVARNASLRVGPVPVLWLPWVSFPIDDRRRSGFLYPSIGSANANGLDLRIPYYLNLAPNQDATLSARVLGRRGVMLGAEYRYLTAQHGGQFEADWLPDDDIAGRDRRLARLRHAGRLGANWNLRADLFHVSDDRYFEDLGDSLAAASTSLLASHAGVYGRGHYWNASLVAQTWEILDPQVPDRSEPFRRLPRADLRWLRPFGDWFELGVRAEAVAFDHAERSGATRYDLQPWLAFPFERGWGHLRPELGWRETGYRLGRGWQDEGFAARSPSRGTPITSLDAGLVFERDTRWFGTPMRQTLQPRLYYLRVPFEDQDDLPLFDTQELTFGFAQLFRSNRFSGADRQMDANQATLALTTRLFETDGGRERLSASLGQIRFFDPQRVQLPGRPAVDASGSAWVGELELMLSDRWRLGWTQQWDPELDATTVSGVRGQWRGAEGAVLNLAYRYRRTVLEQADVSFVLPLAERWRLIGRWNHSLFDDTTLEAFAGFEWEGCCLALRLLGRHYLRNREGEKNNALYLEIELKGLASLGRDTGEFLQRAILGYTR